MIREPFVAPERCPHRTAAFTLIEIVAAMVLMATVMSAALLAFASHQRSSRRAIHRRRAVIVADQLLDRLFATRNGLPTAGSGILPPSITGTDKPWRWQTGVIRRGNVLSIPTQTVRLELRDDQSALLISVEMLLPIDGLTET